jgi:hypothetical protein
MSPQQASEGRRAPAILDRVRRRRRHVALVMDAEVKLLEHALEPFGLLSREELIRRTNAELWSEGWFNEAPRVAVA